MHSYATTGEGDRCVNFFWVLLEKRPSADPRVGRSCSWEYHGTSLLSGGCKSRPAVSADVF